MLKPARDWPELIDRLTDALELLKSAKLTLKLSKCEFAMDRSEYLRIILYIKSEIEAGPRKAEAIRSYPTPKNSHEHDVSLV
ncbi:hypothetical protein Trydic_g23137 [Trypoxylus dichotomus]